jgi:UPF0755 protein
MTTQAERPVRRRRSKKRPSGAPSPSRAPRTGRYRRLAVVAALAAVGLGLLVALASWARSQNPGSGRRFLVTVERHTSARALSSRLRDERAIEAPWLFALYMSLFGKDPAPGIHLLRDDLTPRELAQRLGRSAGRPSVRVTLPEGWNHVQIARRLEELEVTTEGEFRRATFDSKLIGELGLPGPSAEGYLFPATYDLLVDSDASSIVRTLVAEAKKRHGRIEAEAQGVFEQLKREHGFGLHEVVTLASIVERETGDPEELPIVAGVFMNRLSDPAFRPMKTLQSDPTAAYGCLVEPARAPSCVSPMPGVTPAMLRDTANRYNTYRHAGLPPGPIANPGERALRAVLAPAKTDYLFFVAKGGGKHRFSRTFEEHRQALGAPATVASAPGSADKSPSK